MAKVLPLHRPGEVKHRELAVPKAHATIPFLKTMELAARIMALAAEADARGEVFWYRVALPKKGRALPAAARAVRFIQDHYPEWVFGNVGSEPFMFRADPEPYKKGDKMVKLLVSRISGRLR